MFTSILDSVLKEPSIAPYVEQYNGFVASLGEFFPFAVIALCLLVGLFGRRLSGVIRVVLLFAIGFVASVYWVAPLVQPHLPAVPALAIGLALGLLAAVLSRMIYNFVYIGCIGFDVYNICFNAIFLPTVTVYTEGNLPLSIGLAVGAVILALLVRKYLEMIITAAAGGIGIAFFVKSMFDYTVNVNLDPNMTMLIVGAVIAVPMFIYQYYNRVIY
jgi:hypothetical protein